MPRLYGRREFIVMGTASVVGGACFGLAVTSQIVEGKRNAAIQATTVAVENKGWEKLIKEGFPELAIDSAAGIRLYSDDNKYLNAGSGTVMFAELDGKEYWVVLTAGHLFAVEEDFWGSRKFPEKMQGIWIDLIRERSLPNSGNASVRGSDFGIAAVYRKTTYGNVDIADGGLDIAALVIPYEPGNKPGTMFDKDEVVGWNKIYLGEDEMEGGSFYAIGFPYLTGFRPTVVQDGKMASMGGERVDIKEAMAGGGFSGGGVFWRQTDGEIWYIGPAVASFNYQADGVEVVRVAAMGEEGLLGLVREAVKDLVEA